MSHENLSSNQHIQIELIRESGYQLLKIITHLLDKAKEEIYELSVNKSSYVGKTLKIYWWRMILLYKIHRAMLHSLVAKLYLLKNGNESQQANDNLISF